MTIKGYLVTCWNVIQHVILMKYVPNESVPNVVILFELCYQICVLFTLHHFLDSFDGSRLEGAKDEDILVLVVERVFSLTLLISTVIINPGKIFCQL